MLHGRKILIGVTAGIAAYKITFLVRNLIKAGAEVQVILTPSAKSFVTPLTLSTLSKRPVYSDYFDAQTGEWNNHVSFGAWADLIVIAPVTANTLSKMANGQSDNLLLATYLSAKCPVMFAPAMDLDMYQHPTTKKNIEVLKENGDILIPAGTGELASGLSGEGRMAEPEEIQSVIEDFFDVSGPLSNKKVLITAGPTHEAIDPVRFIGNRSSGKMGYALATEAALLGAEVTLISGPTSLHSPEGVDVVRVESAQEMYDETMQHVNYDIAVLAAAVADFKVDNIADQKIKKTSDKMELSLTKTKDILQSLGEVKKDNQFLVGFALESENELENAKGKMERKNLDFVVLNSINDKGATFNSDQNKVIVIDKGNNQKTFELKDKSLVAKDIFALICEKI